MRVHILSRRTTKAYNATYPLRAFRRAIRQRGIDVRIFYQPTSAVSKCDVLILTGEHWKDQLRGAATASLVESVRRYRDAVATLVWLDTTDSSGTTTFEVLPYVDLYAKNQLLKDRTRYTRPFYGMRCYTDFYHHSRGIVDSPEAWRVPARPEDLRKLAVSWNLGLGGYVRANRQTIARLGRLQLYWPAGPYSWKRTAPDDTDRTVAVSFRGRVDYDRATVTFQRRETFRRLETFARTTGFAVAYEGKLPYAAYREEMRNSKIVLSPFGFGEINAGRDFECFVDGAALVKPDMSHLVTWPVYFEPNVTYAAHAWDFSDFEAILTKLLETPDERLRIAAAGQARYLQSLSEEGERAFAGHFEALLQQAQGQGVHDHRGGRPFSANDVKA
jgi:hypothetical protein